MTKKFKFFSSLLATFFLITIFLPICQANIPSQEISGSLGPPNFRRYFFDVDLNEVCNIQISSSRTVHLEICGPWPLPCPVIFDADFINSENYRVQFPTAGNYSFLISIYDSSWTSYTIYFNPPDYLWLIILLIIAAIATVGVVSFYRMKSYVSCPSCSQKIKKSRIYCTSCEAVVNEQALLVQGMKEDSGTKRFKVARRDLILGVKRARTFEDLLTMMSGKYSELTNINTHEIKPLSHGEYLTHVHHSLLTDGFNSVISSTTLEASKMNKRMGFPVPILLRVSWQERITKEKITTFNDYVLKNVKHIKNKARAVGIIPVFCSTNIHGAAKEWVQRVHVSNVANYRSLPVIIDLNTQQLIYNRNRGSWGSIFYSYYKYIIKKHLDPSPDAQSLKEPRVFEIVFGTILLITITLGIITIIFSMT